MVLDILGVLIGFSTVMLLLSVIVTTLVQVCQHVTGMRASNLHVGLSEVVSEFLPDDKNKLPEDDTGPNQPEDEKAKRAENKKKSSADGIASTILELASPLKRGRFKTSLFGGACTWLAPERLPKLARKAMTWLDDDTVSLMTERFEELQTDLQKRFLGKVRVVTIGLSVLVALVFEVNSFALLRKLSTNAEYARLAEALATKATEAQVETENLRTHDQIMIQALDQLAEKEADFKPLKGQAIKNGTVTLELLEAALAGSDLSAARQKELQNSFETIVGKLHLEAAKEASQITVQAKDYLSTLDIAPVTNWADIKSFYWESQDRAGNWLGVLFTAILLSLGAPFWFNMLKKGIGLRDMLKPPPVDPNKKPETANTKPAG